MASIEVKLLKLGESITEATVLNWLKEAGDQVEKDEVILEVSTDKVDSEIAAKESGTIKEILAEINDVVKVGAVLAIIETEGAIVESKEENKITNASKAKKAGGSKEIIDVTRYDDSGRFFSPLVRSMAKKEGISFEDLSNVKGTGANNRVLKCDLVDFIKSGSKPENNVLSTKSGKGEGRHEIIEMDRMRSMIAAVSYTHLTLPTIYSV